MGKPSTDIPLDDSSKRQIKIGWGAAVMSAVVALIGSTFLSFVCFYVGLTIAISGHWPRLFANIIEEQLIAGIPERRVSSPTSWIGALVLSIVLAIISTWLYDRYKPAAIPSQPPIIISVPTPVPIPTPVPAPPKGDDLTITYVMPSTDPGETIFQIYNYGKTMEHVEIFCNINSAISDGPILDGIVTTLKNNFTFLAGDEESVACLKPFLPRATWNCIDVSIEVDRRGSSIKSFRRIGRPTRRGFIWTAQRTNDPKVCF